MDAVLAHGGEDGFPSYADGQGNDVDRHEVECPVQEVVDQVVGIEAYTDQTQQGGAPPRGILARGFESQVGLQAGVIAGHETAGSHGDEYRTHQPLEVKRVAYVGGPLGGLARRVGERVEGIEERSYSLELTALAEVGFQLVQDGSKQLHRLPFFLDSGQIPAQHGAEFLFGRTGKGAQGQVLLVQFQRAQGLGLLDIVDGQRPQQEER